MRSLLRCANKRQVELKALRAHNRTKKHNLLSLAKEEVSQQELRPRICMADNHIKQRICMADKARLPQDHGCLAEARPHREGKGLGLENPE